MKCQKQPQDIFCERGILKHFINLINLSKFLAILYRKQNFKGGHFWQSCQTVLATLLKQ